MAISKEDLKNSMIDVIELYLRDNDDYYKLNHAPAEKFTEVSDFMQKWLVSIGVSVV